MIDSKLKLTYHLNDNIISFFFKTIAFKRITHGYCFVYVHVKLNLIVNPKSATINFSHIRSFMCF
jgi:hypothetical protein